MHIKNIYNKTICKKMAVNPNEVLNIITVEENVTRRRKLFSRNYIKDVCIFIHHNGNYGFCYISCNRHNSRRKGKRYIRDTFDISNQEQRHNSRKVFSSFYYLQLVTGLISFALAIVCTNIFTRCI